MTVERWTSGERASAMDDVVVEEPLEIRISGETLATTMRTPGHDAELALGFLRGEGIIATIDDVSGVAHCGRTGDEGRFNTIDVTPAPGVRIDLDATTAARRGTLTTAACGVCGRRTIDDLLQRCTVVENTERFPRRAILSAVRAMRPLQVIFERTGGCHAAALARVDGTIAALFEDVGRHNAVDKIVGSQLKARALPLSSFALVVTGRISFEIVQKAIAAGIGTVAGVSAPSSLAVDLSRKAEVTVAGFARGESVTVYSGALET